MRIEDWLGEDNQLGIDIWHKKYQRNGETFDQWLDRGSINNEYIRNLIICPAWYKTYQALTA